MFETMEKEKIAKQKVDARSGRRSSRGHARSCVVWCVGAGVVVVFAPRSVRQRTTVMCVLVSFGLVWFVLSLVLSWFVSCCLDFVSFGLRRIRPRTSNHPRGSRWRAGGRGGGRGGVGWDRGRSSRAAAILVEAEANLKLAANDSKSAGHRSVTLAPPQRGGVAAAADDADADEEYRRRIGAAFDIMNKTADGEVSRAEVARALCRPEARPNESGDDAARKDEASQRLE